MERRSQRVRAFRWLCLTCVNVKAKAPESTLHPCQVSIYVAPTCFFCQSIGPDAQLYIFLGFKTAAAEFFQPLGVSGNECVSAALTDNGVLNCQMTLL